MASVIAGGQSGWRETKEKAGGCRFAYVTKDPSPLAEAERLTCYTNEVTAGVTASNAIRDLDALAIPPSMQELVEGTKVALAALVEANLEAACGPAMNEPEDSPECSSALGSRMVGYTLLETQLDKWAPYL